MILDLESRVQVTEWLEVNRQGEGFSIKTGKKLKPELTRQGYYRYTTRFNGKSVKILAHRAVALAFIPNPLNCPTVNHKDAVKTNNNVDNLEWATYQEQQDHARGLGLVPTVYGEDTSNNVYSEDTIRNICKDMENGLRNHEIVKKYNVDVKLPSDIRNKRSWETVSKDYNILEKQRGSVPEYMVHNVCKLLCLGWGVVRIFNYYKDSCPELSKSKIKHIKLRNSYKHISENYNY